MFKRNLILTSTAILLALAGVGLWAAPSASDAESTKVERIREVMELTGAGDLGMQVMQLIVEPMKGSLPDVPAEVWDEILEGVSADDLVELTIPIYDRNFTSEEIDAMLVFYRTPAGQSMMRKMPVVVQESMMAGQAWGQAIAQDAIAKLQAKGYDLPASLSS